MTHKNVFAPIQAVRIQNFRAVRDLTIELDSRVTMFFSVNAAGKTTILDAIAIGLGAVGARVPKATGRDFAKSGDVRVPWKDRPDAGERTGVECTFARVEIRETAEARTLREELDRAIAGDRRLHQADLEIQKRQLLARLRVAKQ